MCFVVRLAPYTHLTEAINASVLSVSGHMAVIHLLFPVLPSLRVRLPHSLVESRAEFHCAQ